MTLQLYSKYKKTSIIRYTIPLIYNIFNIHIIEIH